MQIITKLKQFLLTNTSSKQTVIKNTFWLLLAEGISKGSLAVLVIMIGRIFGKEVFGQYSYLSVLLTFLIVFADLGITQLTIRDYQHLDVKHRRQYLISGLWTKLRLSIAVAVVYCIILFFIGGGFSSLRGSGADEAILASTKPSSSFLRLIGLILLSNNLTNSFLEYMRSTFRSLQRGETELRVKFVQGIGNLLLIPLLFVYQSLPLNLIGQSVVTLVTIGYTWYLVRNRQLTEHTDEIATTKKQLIQNGWMFAMSGLAGAIYFYIDSVLLQYYYGFEVSGIYSAMYRLSLITLIPVSMFSQSMFASIGKGTIDDIEKKTLVKGYYKNVILIGGLIFSVLILSSKFLIIYTYGEGYAEGVSVLRILFAATFLIYGNTILATFLQSLGGEKTFMKITTIGLIVNIILNLLLIPRYGLISAALTTFVTEFVIGVLLLYKSNIFNLKS